MKLQSIPLRRLLSPRFVTKALHSFDKATTVIVSLSWGGALLVLLFALYTVNMAMQARQQVAEAESMEPNVPQLRQRPPTVSELEPLVKRLERRFTGVSFSLGNDRSLTVVSNDAGQFRTWLMVLGYIDTITPQYRWQIKSLCVGSLCPGTAPMRAILTVQKISFVIEKDDE
ncbi:MAG: hypothetical protein FWF24_02895 [Alphaproteobacteria bacterium]|nr:hypothetical protein [Alphaproteobacteria bacterium]